MFPYVRVCSRRKWGPLTGKKLKYASSHLPRFMFIFALCLLNEPFIQSRSIFTIFSYSIFAIFYIFYFVQLKKKKIYIHTVHAILDFFLGSIGPIWGSFAVLGSFAARDHLRACSTYTLPWGKVKGKYVFPVITDTCDHKSPYSDTSHGEYITTPGFLGLPISFWKRNTISLANSCLLSLLGLSSWVFGKVLENVRKRSCGPRAPFGRSSDIYVRKIN